MMGEGTDGTENRIQALLRDQYGNFPVQTALAEADKDQRDKLLSIIIPLMPNLRHTPCGRRLEGRLNELECKGELPNVNPSSGSSSWASSDLLRSELSEASGSEHQPNGKPARRAGTSSTTNSKSASAKEEEDLEDLLA